MGSKERRTKAITIFKGGEKKTQKTNPSFLREHTAGSHHVLLGDALYYFVRSFSVQYQTGLLRFLSVFFLFPFGLRAESHFKQWAEQFLGGKNGEKKKKERDSCLECSPVCCEVLLIISEEVGGYCSLRTENSSVKRRALLFWSFIGSWRTKGNILSAREQSSERSLEPSRML